jgi:DNA-binding transcriptional LysR family regulator
VATYSSSRPDVQLELRQLEPEPAIRALLAGDLDLAVVYRYGAIEGRVEEDRIAWKHLFDDPYAVALPSGHRLAGKPKIALADLAGERWVSPPADTPWAGLLRRLCHEHGGFEPEVIFETSDIAMAQPLVASGLVVSLLPDLGLRPRHEGVVVRPLESVPPARTVEVLRPAKGEVPTVAPMVEALGGALPRTRTRHP